MPQHALRVFQDPMLLHVGPQRPEHRLEGDETVRNTQLPGNRTDPPPEEVLSPARNRCPFRSPGPNVGNTRASGEESLESFLQASMTGRTEFD